MNTPQIVITIVLLLVLILAIVQFLKTPRNKSFITFPEDKKVSDPSYSPEYSKKEKISMVIKYGSWMLLFYVCFQLDLCQSVFLNEK